MEDPGVRKNWQVYYRVLKRLQLRNKKFIQYSRVKECCPGVQDYAVYFWSSRRILAYTEFIRFTTEWNRASRN
jgi:hypothetical protein